MNQQSNPQQRDLKKSFSVLGLITVITIAFVFGEFSLWGKPVVADEAPQQIAELTTYTNERYGYKARFPQGWKVIEAKPRKGNKAAWEEG